MTEREKIGAVWLTLRSSCQGYGWRTPEYLAEQLAKQGRSMTVEDVLAELKWLRSLNAVEDYQGVWRPAAWRQG